MSPCPGSVLVTVGDELLLGETVDSNAAWLGRELSTLGVEILRRYTVGDGADEIRTALRRGLREADLVLLTGGLGPTEDDRTRPVVADELGAPLRLDEAMLKSLRQRFRRHGYDELPRSNESQARVPEGAVVLPNARGTAPGLLLESGEGALVVLLPGVPAEMKGIFERELAPRLRERFGARLRPVRHRTIHTTGVSESELADRLDEALSDEMGQVALAFLPDVTGVDLRLTVRGIDDENEAAGRLDRVEEAIAAVVGPWRYEAGESGDLVEPLSRALEARGWLLGAAESCTGGLLAKRMTDRPGSSSVFAGGIVAYGNRAKVELLGVDVEVLDRDGAVSGAVARQMARGAARALQCACGVGITGIAGPDGGTEEKPVGLVWYAASVGERVRARSSVFPGDRDAVRQRSVQATLALLMEMLRAGEEGEET